jgi:hypothetical protein
LTARFYADLGERASWLARLAKDLRENKLLLTKSEQALAAAAQLGPMVEIELPGLDGFVAPLPFFDGEEPGKEGCRAVIRMQSSPSCQGCESIEVDTLDRVTCRDHLPPADAERTSTGALREIYSAMKLFNTRTEMMAMGFSDARKGLGQIRAFIPGQSRAGYLNEIIRAGREAGMHTVFVMGTAPSGKDLRQITVALSEPKKKGKSKGKTKLVEVRCKDDETMSKCARRMAEARGGGAALIYRLDDG